MRASPPAICGGAGGVLENRKLRRCPFRGEMGWVSLDDETR